MGGGRERKRGREGHTQASSEMSERPDKKRAKSKQASRQARRIAWRASKHAGMLRMGHAVHRYVPGIRDAACIDGIGDA